MSLDPQDNLGAKDMETFVAVARALVEVRDQHLYRGVAPTFEAYCSSRYGLDAEGVNDLISLAEQYAARGMS